MPRVGEGVRGEDALAMALAPEKAVHLISKPGGRKMSWANQLIYLPVSSV